MRLVALPLALAACSGDPIPKNQVDLDITSPTLGTLGFHRTDRTAYQFNGTETASIAWPGIEEYGSAPEQVITDFLPNLPGRQPVKIAVVTGGALQPSMSVVGTFEVRWTGARDVPIELEATFDHDDGAGTTVLGSLTASDASCMTSTPTNTWTGCGQWVSGDPGPATWTQTFAGCPAEVLEAAVGAEPGGSWSNDEVVVGPVELECVTTYDDDLLCGNDTFQVDVAGCTWDVFVYAGGRGSTGPGLELRVEAGNSCPDAPITACETILLSNP
ncbi:MAG: hypothetical protein H6735_14795 [Alphaproteobacteria bacterium]|nr:hypothetical protein [Alphaproteobacteria bacterium]